MKIWKGAEMEGRDKGIITLFVEATALSLEQLETIKEIARQEQISRIYLGAGKVDTLVIDNLDILNGCNIIIEVSFDNYNKIKDKELYNEIIVRFDLDADLNKLRLKADNGKDVIIYYNGVKNTLNGVLDGLYAKDIMIYEQSNLSSI